MFWPDFIQRLAGEYPPVLAAAALVVVALTGVWVLFKLFEWTLAFVLAFVLLAGGTAALIWFLG